MNLLRKPRNLILMVYKSLKIKVCFETLLAKKTYWRGLNDHFLNSKRLYALLLFPAVSGILALLHFDIIFKSGTAGFGILILLILYFDKLCPKRMFYGLRQLFCFLLSATGFCRIRMVTQVCLFLE